MKPTTQMITVNIYLEAGKPTAWQVQAQVVGDWAVHQPHSKDSLAEWANYTCITHLPSGAAAFVTRNREVALKAAQRLAGMNRPQVALAQDSGSYMPHVVPLPLEWIDKLPQILAGLDIWACTEGGLVAPEDLPSGVRASRRRKAQATA